MAKNKPEIPTDLLNFLDRLPNDLQEKMTPKVRNQFFLWDEILKRDITLYPRHILPLIQEIFHRTYPADIKIEAVSTEYSVSRISLQNGKRLSAIHSDLLLKVGEKDYYHFECQIEEDETMAIRMLEYDLHAGLAHGAGQPASANAPFHLSLPNSAVLYLSHSKRTPDFLACKLHFQDGSSHLFRVPVLKVQAYTTEMVAERGLYLLIPFLPIRVRKYLKRKNGSAIAKNKLTILIQKCMIVLEDGMASGRLTGNERSDLTEFLFAACSSIFAGEPDFLEEVHDMMEPAIKLRREIYAEQHAEIMQQQLEIAQQKLEI
ncbi:MAG: hypothetical protein Q4F41_18680, partial [Eubacteriales bacterium]|nr:hypothetical protein [Eubacteriales bacterium]